MVGGLVDERIDLNVHCLQALRSLASPRQPVSPASAVWLHQAVDFHIIGCGIPNTEIELLLAMAEVRWDSAVSHCPPARRRGR